MSIQRHFFGTDGIRGPVNLPPMTTEIAHAVGAAVVSYFSQTSKKSPRIVLGRDTRVSSPILEAAFSSAAAAMGASVLSLGVLPTPAVACLLRFHNADLGVMISASHNPFQDNGIKIFDSKGYKLSDETEADIESAIQKALQRELSWPSSHAIGSMDTDHLAPDTYLGELLKTWPSSLSLQGKTLLVDAAHGAAFVLGPALFRKLGATVLTRGISPDGRNINEGSGSLFPEALQREVLDSKADIGIALDGDADRLLLVDEKGQILDGDEILAICAPFLQAKGRLPHDTVVSTVMSNLGLDLALKKHQIRLLRTPVGDRYVSQTMREVGAELGGEQSGHLIFAEHSTTGDGLMAALQILQIMLQRSEPLSEIAKAMTRLPQVLRNLRVREKRPWEEIEVCRKAVESAQAALGEQGRVLVRYSGTEKKVRIMLEGPDLAQLQALLSPIEAAFQEALGI